MAAHVNIGEAKTRLSELVAAALRGEEVVLDEAGAPQARSVPVGDAGAAARERRIAKRRAAMGMFADAFRDHDLSLAALKQDRDPDRRERKAVDGAP